MLPVLQDESDLLLDEASEGLDTPGVEILGEDVEDGVAPPEDRLPQLPGLVQLLLQLVSPLQLQPLQGKTNISSDRSDFWTKNVTDFSSL